MDIDTIKKLSLLSRIEVPEEEYVGLTDDLDRILSYVSSLQKVSDEVINVTTTDKNVLRNDDNPHESGIFANDLISLAPKSENGFIQVDKVIDK